MLCEELFHSCVRIDRGSVKGRVARKGKEDRAMAMEQSPSSQQHVHIYMQGQGESQRRASVGVLLVHGLNGDRSDMAELETVLQEHGYLTNNMLLPGHGTKVRDLMASGWDDWETAVRQELQAMKIGRASCR